MKEPRSDKVLILTADYMVYRKCALPYLRFYFPHLDVSDISVIVLGRPEKFVWEFSRSNILGFADNLINLFEIFKKLNTRSIKFILLPAIKLSRFWYISLLLVLNFRFTREIEMVIIDQVYDKRYLKLGSLTSMLRFVTLGFYNFKNLLFEEFKYVKQKIGYFFSGIYLYFIFKFFSGKQKTGFEGICVVYKSKFGIGDFILSTLFLDNLKIKFSHKKMVVLISDEFKDIAKCVPFVDEWVFLKKHFFQERKSYAIFKNRFEEIYMLDGGKHKLPIFLKNSICGEKVFHLRKVLYLTELRLMQNGSSVTAINIYNYFLKKHGVPVSAQLPKLDATDDSKEKIRRILFSKEIYDDDVVVVMTPGTAEHKRWSLDRFASVADYLFNFFHVKVVIAEVFADYDTYPDNEVSRLMKNKNLNLAGLLTADLYVALIERSALLIVNDTGASQVAAALGKNCVVIHGSTHSSFMGHNIPSYKIIKPHVECAPCNLSRCLFDKRLCFDSISVKMVVDEASVFLTETLNKSNYEASQS